MTANLEFNHIIAALIVIKFNQKDKQTASKSVTNCQCLIWIYITF